VTVSQALKQNAVSRKENVFSPKKTLKAFQAAPLVEGLLSVADISTVTVPELRCSPWAACGLLCEEFGLREDGQRAWEGWRWEAAGRNPWSCCVGAPGAKAEAQRRGSRAGSFAPLEPEQSLGARGLGGGYGGISGRG